MGQDLFEIEQKQTMGREEAAARLRTLADQLARQNDVRLERGGRDITVSVPDRVEVEVEVEIGDDGESELEISLSW